MSGDEVLAAIRADPAARPEIPGWTDALARAVIEDCWSADGVARPSFAEVKEVLGRWYCSDDVGGVPAEAYL